MAESSSHFAQTVHRLLKFDPSHGGFTVNDRNPLTCDFLIMDEASMLDVRLAAALVRAIHPRRLSPCRRCRSTPLRGLGNVLKDLIDSTLFSVTRLEVTFRQAETSGIVGLAHGILAGKGSPPPPIDSPDEIDPLHASISSGH